MDYATARFNMVENQIRTNRVSDPLVTKVFLDTPREAFLSKDMRGYAYVDEDLDLGGGRYAIEPMVLARMVETAGITSSDSVLCIGDASGYVAAVAARLAQSVVSLECSPEWVRHANDALSAQGIDNAVVVQGDLAKGYPSQAPFDVILFAGAVPEIPPVLCRQLSEGGRLAGVIQGAAGMGRATLMVRSGDSWGRRVLFDASTPLLPGFLGKPGFVF